jgi:enoyl-CoA hydratase/carnithine racemase
MQSAREPFRVEREDGVLTLHLDTPGCDVNIFSARAAAQLVEILDDVSPTEVRAIVVRSAKEGSFVNGVGLMLANAVHDPSDVPRLTEPVRRAYRALAEAPVPTIAAVQGNCYGCGVELSLMCDFRVAQHSWDTHFYMTELADYLFVPCFGGTQNLPRLLGLPVATEFLLWGQRWSAPEALGRGLVDSVYAPDGFDQGLQSFLGDVLSGTRTARPRHARWAEADEGFAAETRSRIDSLPARVRAPYHDCFSLMEAAAQADAVGAEDYEREMLASGRSVMNEVSKNAQAYFFVRQLSRQVTTRGAHPKARPRLILQDLPMLEAALRGRRLLEVEVASADDVGENEDGVRLGPYGDDGRVDATVALLPVRAAIAWGPGIVAYAPCYSDGARLVEVAMRDGDDAPKAALLADALGRAGFEAVVSRPDRRFAVDGMIDAYFAPLHAHVEAGGTAAEVDASLRDAGFIRGPAALAALVPEHSGARLFMGGPLGAAEPCPVVVEAVLLSLLRFVVEARRKGILAHPSVADVMAREILDFPLADGSLCRLLTPQRVGDALQHEERLRHLLGAETLELARAYQRDGQGFYR